MSPVEGSVFLDGEQIQRFASKEVARRMVCWRKTPPRRGYYRAGAGLPRAPSAPAAVYPLAQGGRRGREARDAGDGHHRAGPAKRRYPLRRTAPARVDRNGAGAGNLDHAAGRADDRLDISHQIDLLELLSELNRTQGYTGGGVARLNRACRYATHLIALRDGEIVAQGAPKEIVTPELIARIYGMRCMIIDDPVAGTPLVVPLGKRAV